MGNLHGTVKGFFRRKRSDALDAELEQASSAIATPLPRQTDGDPEEASPLAERLRHMDWPTPPDEVRERCLREIMSRVAAQDPNADVPDPAELPAGDHRQAAG
jgi:hypothetical protein